MIPAYDCALVVNPAPVSEHCLGVVELIIFPSLSQCAVSRVTGVQPFIGDVTSAVEAVGK